MIAPDSFRDRAINAVRATGWMAVPLMAEVVARLITSGDLARQARMKRDKAALRNAIVRRVLKEWLPPSDSAPGFHIWLPLPAGRTMNALVTQAAQAGIQPGSRRGLDDFPSAQRHENHAATQRAQPHQQERRERLQPQRDCEIGRSPQ